MLRCEVYSISLSRKRGASDVFLPTSVRPTVCVRTISVAGTLGTAMLCLASAGGCGGVTAQSRNSEGVRLFEQSRYQESVSRFEQAIAADPNNADGYYNMAAVYHRLSVLTGDPSSASQAENYYNQCLDHDDEHQECYRGLAVLLMEQERSEEAFRLLEGWVDRHPMAAEPKIELARMFEEFGDPQAAKEQLVEALSVDAQNSRALAALGKLREQMGEHALALNNYQQSLWQDRFQPDVSARVAALEAALSPTPLMGTSPPGATRIVTRGGAPVR